MECILCGNKNLKFIGNNPSFPECKVYECKKCEFALTYPLPTSQQVLDFYKNTYLVVKNDSILNLEKRLRSSEQRALSQFKFIEKYFPRLKDVEALDVGCSDGALLLLLDSHGFHIRGYDPDSKMAEFANKRLAKKENLVKNMLFEEDDALEIENKTYDLVCSSHVFEHLVDPVAHLSKVKKIMKSSGVLFMEVPNEYRMGVANCINTSLFPIAAIQGHFCYYSLNSVKKILELSGFKVITIKTCGEDAKTFFNIKNNLRVFNSSSNSLHKLCQKTATKLRNIFNFRSCASTSNPSPFTTYWEGTQEGVWIRLIASPTKNYASSDK